MNLHQNYLDFIQKNQLDVDSRTTLMTIQERAKYTKSNSNLNLRKTPEKSPKGSGFKKVFMKMRVKNTESKVHKSIDVKQALESIMHNKRASKVEA